MTDSPRQAPSSQRPGRPAQQHGVLILDKPKGPTSTWCLETIKRKLGQKKIGHAGTLDPMAQGVLVIMLGRATKIGPYLLEGDKTYLGRLKLGETTDTYDAEGEVTATAPWEHIPADAVEAGIARWLTLTEQEVPPYSAAKHQGKPLYELARKGKDVPVKTKPVDILEAQVTEMDLPFVTFRVRVSSGVYIRSLVHSLGMRLGSGAVLTALTREYSRPFGLEEARSLDDLLARPESLPERVISLTEALRGMPRIALTGEMAGKVRLGMRLRAADLPPAQAGRETAPGEEALFLDPEGEALAVCRAGLFDGELRWAINRGLW